jgi:PKD repeat protein
VFKEDGNYEVQLTVTDAYGRTNSSSISVSVTDSNLLDRDTDGD